MWQQGEDLRGKNARNLSVFPFKRKAAQNINSILGFIARGVVSKEREGIVPFYSAPLRPHLEYRVPAWGSQHKKDMELLGHVQRRVKKMIRGLEYLSYEKKLDRV